MSVEHKWMEHTKLHMLPFFSSEESINNCVSDAIAATNLSDFSSKSWGIGNIVIVSSFVGTCSDELVELVNFSSLWRKINNIIKIHK